MHDRTEGVGTVISGAFEIAPVILFTVCYCGPYALAVVYIFAFTIFKFTGTDGASRGEPAYSSSFHRKRM